MTRAGSVCIISSNPTIHLFRWVAAIRDSEKPTVIDVSSREVRLPFAEHCRFHKLPIKGVSPAQGLVSCIRAAVLASRSEFVNIHFVNPFLAMFSLMIPGKIILSFWGTDGLVEYRNSSGFKHAVYASALRKASRITYNSQVLAETLSRYRDKLFRVNWPVELDSFHPCRTTVERNELRKLLGIGSEEIVLLSTRPVRPMYRILELVESCRSRAGTGRLRLIVHVPKGPDLEYLEACKKAAEGCRVDFSERFLSRDEMAGLYRVSDVYLSFPVSDSYPSSMLEAMACGCVVVVSKDTWAYEHIRKDFSIITAGFDELGEDFFVSCLREGEAARSGNERKVREEYTVEEFSSVLSRLYAGA